MQTVLTMHDPSRFQVFFYSLSPSDDSVYRNRIQSQARLIRDISAWTTQRVAEQIVKDEIHIC